MLENDLQHGPHADSEPATRQRLLDAAGEVFSEHGFRDATIRDICTRASANIAAVNYHFRDKERLYQEVLRYADRCASEIKAHQLREASAAGLPARERLRLFIRAYVAAMLDSGRHTWQGRLIAREMMDPSPALDVVIDQNIRPRSEMLEQIIRELLGADHKRPEDEALVTRIKLSVIGQCMIYHCGRRVVERLHPSQVLSAQTLDATAEHITGFTLGAIESLCAGRQCEGGTL